MLGILAVAAASAMAGYMESRKLGIRVTQLEKFLAFLSAAKTEIRYSAMPVERIVEKHGSGLKFLVLCTGYCAQGEVFRDAWERGLKEGTAGSGLTQQDIDYIRSFGLGFGATDVEGQLSHCQLYFNFLSDALMEAKKEKEQKSKLYFMLGIFGGIAAALLLS